MLELNDIISYWKSRLKEEVRSLNCFEREEMLKCWQLPLPARNFIWCYHFRLLVRDMVIIWVRLNRILLWNISMKFNEIFVSSYYVEIYLILNI